MSQRLQAAGVHVVEFAFTSEGRRRLFSVLLDLVRGRRLRARPHEQLRRELLGLEVREGPGGWRVDHRSTQHDDHVVATALGAQQVAGADRDVHISLGRHVRASAGPELLVHAGQDPRRLVGEEVMDRRVAYEMDEPW